MSRRVELPGLVLVLLVSLGWLLLPACSDSKDPAPAGKGGKPEVDLKGAQILATQHTKKGGDKTRLYRIDVASGKMKLLASFPRWHKFDGLNRPVWSPDGRKILYSYERQCYEMNADGTGVRKLLEGRTVYDPFYWEDPKTREVCIIFNDNNQRLWWPRHKNKGRTYRYRPRTGKVEKIENFPYDAGLSLDGTHIADAYGGVLIKDYNTGEVHILNDKNNACNGSISPDNTYRVLYLYQLHDYFGIRNKFDKELWKILKPKGSDEWQTPRWGNHPDYCAAVAKFKGEYKIVIVQISTQKTIALRKLPGDWRVPVIWAPSGRAVQMALTSPIDHLKLGWTHRKYRKILARAADYSPVLSELAGRRHKDARAIVRVLEDLGRGKLTAAAAEEDAREARATYREVAAMFRDHPLGAEARKTLASAAFQRELAAAPVLGELKDLEVKLLKPPRVPQKFDDSGFLQLNQAQFVRMVELMQQLRWEFDGTRALASAEKVADRYGLPEETEVAGNVEIRFLGTIKAVSKVPTAQQIAPYTKSIAYVLYNVEEVLEGEYSEKEIVVAHWGMRDRKFTEVAHWRPGLKQELSVDLFNAHPKLAKVTKAVEAMPKDNFLLQPYWALKVEER